MTDDPPFEGQVGVPELDAFSGAGIHLRHCLIRIDAETGFRGLNLGQMDGIVLALDWVADTKHHIWGTAVMVAPGVALTARHTIDAMRDAGFLADVGGILLAYGFHAQGMMIWNAVKVEQDPSGDLAVLTLVRATAKPAWPADAPLPVNAATIAARMPLQGETLSLIGFKAVDLEFVGSASDVRIDIGLYAGVGPVLDIYELSRDRSMPKPSGYVDARTIGGMSGGGAFDAAGRLVGIISKGLDAETGDGPSFILLSWPILFMEFEVVWPPGLSQSPTSLHAMAAHGLSSIDGIENVVPGRDSNGTSTVTLITRAEAS